MKKRFFTNYKHSFMLLYFFIYMPWFTYLETTVVKNYHVIHMKIDDFIPFNEYFIIPYLLWFFYVAATVVFFFFKDKKEFYQLTIFLFIGMTIFLIISTVFPNGQHLRPTTFARDNFFVDLVKQLYRTDTPTNIFPSIHVFNSIVVHISICKSIHLSKNKWLHLGSFILMSSIIMATVFLKQHSVFDVLTAILMAASLYPILYKFDFALFKNKKKKYNEQYDN